MEIIFETAFGSHLYGLSTPSSDKDYKGIILPTKREILLGKSNYHVDRSSNTSSIKNNCNDVDRSYYTLSYWLDLAIKGETVCIDMVHGGKEFHTISNPIWDYIVEHRQKFLCKSMKSYIGYCRKQAAKYSIKGAKVGELENIITFLEQQLPNTPVGNLSFPDTVCGKWVLYKDIDYYEFAGSKFQDNLKVKFMLDTLRKMYNNYGDRSKLAKTNNFADWKAMGHALRTGYQARDIFLHGGFEYPLKETKFLMDVKLGKLDFINEVEPELDRIVNEVMVLSDASTYPEKVDRVFWDDFLESTHLDIINR